MDFIMYPMTPTSYIQSSIRMEIPRPQGSVLRLLLFILYTSNVIFFAASLGAGAHSNAQMTAICTSSTA